MACQAPGTCWCRVERDQRLGRGASRLRPGPRDRPPLGRESGPVFAACLWFRVGRSGQDRWPARGSAGVGAAGLLPESQRAQGPREPATSPFGVPTVSYTPAHPSEPTSQLSFSWGGRQTRDRTTGSERSLGGISGGTGSREVLRLPGGLSTAVGYLLSFFSIGSTVDLRGFSCSSKVEGISFTS